MSDSRLQVVADAFEELTGERPDIETLARMWRGRSALWMVLRDAERGTEGMCHGCRAYISESQDADDDYNEPHDADCPVLSAQSLLDPAEVAEIEWRRAWGEAHRERERRVRDAERLANPNPGPFGDPVATLNGLFREVYGEALPSLARVGASDLSFHRALPQPTIENGFGYSAPKPNPAAESYEAKLEQARRFLDAGLISDQQFTDIIAGRAPLQTSTGLVIADKMPKPR